MKTVTLEVATLQEVKRRAQAAFTGRKQGARISFATPELLFQVMTAKRWELLRTMTGAGPLAIREAARRVDRDVKGVHGDVHAPFRRDLATGSPNHRTRLDHHGDPSDRRYADSVVARAF